MRTLMSRPQLSREMLNVKEFLKFSESSSYLVVTLSLDAVSQIANTTRAHDRVPTLCAHGRIDTHVSRTGGSRHVRNFSIATLSAADRELTRRNVDCSWAHDR